MFVNRKLEQFELYNGELQEEKPSNLPIASVSEPIEILSPSSNSHQDMESLGETVIQFCVLCAHIFK